MTTDTRGSGGHLDLLGLDAVRAGEGTAEERAHVEACPFCREELEALRLLAEDVAATRPEAPPVPEAVDRAVREAFREAAGRKVVPFPARRRLPWAGPAAALALAAGLAAVLVLGPPARREAEGPPSRAPSVTALPAEAPAPEAAEGAAAGAARPQAVAAAPAAPPETKPPPAGAVTILDAYRLALRVEEGAPGPAASDVDGDGAVGEKDVEALARLAVALR